MPIGGRRVAARRGRAGHGAGASLGEGRDGQLVPVDVEKGGAVVDEATYTSPSDTGSSFRRVDCTYVYDIAASNLGVGTYEVSILIDGQVVGSATFTLAR